MTHYTTLVQRCRATNTLLADEFATECERLERVALSEREAREKAEKALAAKDRAMGVLFDRLSAAGVKVPSAPRSIEGNFYVGDERYYFIRWTKPSGEIGELVRRIGSRYDFA
jgi:hypothetical protein